jgi:hypothetical protein
MQAACSTRHTSLRAQRHGAQVSRNHAHESTPHRAEPAAVESWPRSTGLLKLWTARPGRRGPDAPAPPLPSEQPPLLWIGRREQLGAEVHDIYCVLCMYICTPTRPLSSAHRTLRGARSQAHHGRRARPALALTAGHWPRSCDGQSVERMPESPSWIMDAPDESWPAALASASARRLRAAVARRSCLAKCSCAVGVPENRCALLFR